MTARIQTVEWLNAHIDELEATLATYGTNAERYRERKGVVAMWHTDEALVFDEAQRKLLDSCRETVLALAFNASNFPIVGLSFRATAEGVTLVVKMLVPDRDNPCALGEVWRSVSVPWAPLASNGADHLVRWVRETIANVMAHEVDEALTLGGIRVFDPHRPLRTSEGA